MNNKMGQRLSAEMARQFDGGTWYSSNFEGVIKNIAADDALKKFNGFPNSIVEIVVHMNQWKIFSIKKLEGDAGFDIVDDSDKNWKRFTDLTDEQWKEILENFEETHKSLALKINGVGDEQMDDTVPGREYSFFYLIMGIIEHEVWHMMQIKFLKRLLQIPETE